MEAVSTVDNLSHTFTCCEPCVKNYRCRKVIMAITFILMTFDLVTDWINWKQWSEAGGYDQYHFVFIFTTAFLCVALIGTTLWITETIAISLKLLGIIKTVGKHGLIHNKGKYDANEEIKIIKRERLARRLGILALILTGLLEDFPVPNVFHLYFSNVWYTCKTGSFIKPHYGNNSVIHVKLTVDH